MIENIEARDKNKVCAAVLTDLSKAFDCLKHDLLIGKLHPFGFNFKFLRNAYFSNRVPAAKVSKTFCSELLWFPSRLSIKSVVFQYKYN